MHHALHVACWMPLSSDDLNTQSIIIFKRFLSS